MDDHEKVVKPWSEGHILGIMGRKGSGKDTVFSMISEMSPVPVKRFAFADRLKYILVKDFGLLRGILHGTQEEKDTTLTRLKWSDRRFSFLKKGREGFLTYREAMTAVGELYGTTFFAKALMGEIFTFQAYNPGYLIVVTDVRFHKEYWTLTRAGARFLKLLGKPSGPGTDHPSETLKEKADITIPAKGFAPLEVTQDLIPDALWRLFGIELKQDDPYEDFVY